MQKNWYAVITADVLYDKELTPRQKLLVAIISNLSNDKGYCFATNAYFAEMLQCSVSSIQRDLNVLEEKYIGRVVKLKSNGEVDHRALTPVSHMGRPHSTSDTTPHSTSDTYNNKEFNNKSNNYHNCDFEGESEQDETKPKEPKRTFNDASKDSVQPIDQLYERYKKDDIVIDAVIKHSKYLENKEQLVFMLGKFQEHLKQTGDTSKNWKGYASHFRNWINKQGAKKNAKIRL